MASAATALLASSAVLLVATTFQLMISTSAAATLPLSAPAPVGMPGCNTTCGDVEVPYPFGFGQARCYWPGLKLTCDTTNATTRPPRLLLGDGTDDTLRVTAISLANNTVRVVGKAGILLWGDSNITFGRWKIYPFGRSFGDLGYRLSSMNELALLGCNVVATLLGNATGQGLLNTLGGCASFCDWDHGPFPDRSCVAPVARNSSLPLELQISSLYSRKQAGATASDQQLPVYAVVAEEGWASVHLPSPSDDDLGGEAESPLILQWAAVTQDDLRQPRMQDDECPDDVRRKLCKSQHSDCTLLDQSSHYYTCRCRQGYDGNPYLHGGCQDIDECKLPSEDTGCRSGEECTNTVGSFYCECPRGSYVNSSSMATGGGCVRNISSDSDSTTGGQYISSSYQHTTSTTSIGLPGCNTSCGKVQVPYPFGLGPAGCYWPGLNLTCDTSQDPARLLLGDGSGTLLVVEISLSDTTVRIIRNLNFTTLDDTTVLRTPNYTMTGLPVAVFDYLPNVGESYSLSARNEFVLNGCGVEATLQLMSHGGGGGGGESSSSSTIVLSSNCSGIIAAATGPAALGAPIANDYCSGTNGCCHAPIVAAAGTTPKSITFVRSQQVLTHLVDENVSHLVDENATALVYAPIYAFLTEGPSSLMDQNLHMNLYRDSVATFRQMASPLLLQWAVKQGFPKPAKNMGPSCPGDVARRLCTSDHSYCRQEHGGYTCQCSQGYDGNPYIADGCKEIDLCKIARMRKECFGDCENFGGSYKCRCSRGTHGNPYLPNGCRPSVTGLSIGIGVGSGAGIIVLVLIAVYMTKKLKHRRSMKLKQKFFKQNRGQLLQQLVAQRADIAERMIITLEELEKATNNFDKARELGGGGHGTVYKGILSDLHVVAIKKSKIAVQREIDEFINEVAILSQICHRNVVKLFGCCLETEVPLLVYEFVSNGTLDSHLHVQEAMSLSWTDRLRIATETAKAIAYLHSATSIPIIHRDIKSTNILLDDTLTSKVSDFGASRHIPIDRTGVTTNVQGTIGYLDPAYYSFGVLLVELLTRKKPYSCVSSDGLGLVAHFVTMHTSGSLVDILDQQVMQEGGNQQAIEVAVLAVSCVKMSGDERPTMRQVEMTLEAIQAKVQTSNIVVAEAFEENIIRRRMPSDREGRSLQAMTRRHSLEEEFLMSARYPR